MEAILLVVLIVIVVLILLGRRRGSLGGLIANGIVGVVLLFLTNLLFLEDDIPIDLINVLICAIGGVVGWLIILILHLLGITL